MTLISSTLLVTRPVQSSTCTGTLGVTPSQKEDDPRARPSHRHRGAVRAAEAPTGSVDYLLGTGLNDFLVDRAR